MELRHDCYFGGPAGSESPVALRRSLARGLLFRLLALTTMLQVQVQINGQRSHAVSIYQIATEAQRNPALPLRLPVF